MDNLDLFFTWFNSFWWRFWETIRWDVPKVALTVLFIAFFFSIWKLQKRPRTEFDFGEIYKDENNKVSAGRFILVGSWIVGTWYVMQTMMDGIPDVEIYAIYMGGTGLTGLGMKALDKFKMLGGKDGSSS